MGQIFVAFSEYPNFKWIELWGVIWHLFLEDLCQNKKLFEIKLPLISRDDIVLFLFFLDAT
jgi:hypothetical protein